MRTARRVSWRSAAFCSAWEKVCPPRDSSGAFGEICRFRVAETGLSGVSGSKAAEDQRLFRRRQKAGVAQECVVQRHTEHEEFRHDVREVDNA
jgi:hypothetical protein